MDDQYDLLSFFVREVEVSNAVDETDVGEEATEEDDVEWHQLTMLVHSAPKSDG